MKQVSFGKGQVEKYFINRSQEVRDAYKKSNISVISLGWDGHITETRPRSSRTQLKELNADFNKDLEVYLFHPSQLDIIKKPLIPFLSPRNIIETTLYIQDVKQGLENVIEKEGSIDIKKRKQGSNILFEMEYSKSGHDIEVEDFEEHKEGYYILKNSLEKLQIHKGISFDWWWIPPAAGAIILALAKGTYNYYSEVWREGTKGAIEKAELLGIFEGGIIGGSAGAMFDLISGVYLKGKDIIEEPINRLKLTKQLKKYF